MMRKKSKRWAVYSKLIQETADEMRKNPQLKDQAGSLEGDAGEAMTEKLFAKLGFDYEKVPQKVLKKIPKRLSELGGKRPDYILSIGDEFANSSVVVADAKFYSTNGQSEFLIKEDEYNKYCGLIKYIEEQYEVQDVTLLFIVWPKEAHFQTYYIFDLEALSTLLATAVCDDKPARKLSFSDPTVLKFDIDWDAE
ncbi:hypothetical protein AB2373_16820 [Vibrio cholerae]|uniref:hypothetical protein n=1 Tax=Vibrio cholerae TaxID=666 RepID=UPI003F955375